MAADVEPEDLAAFCSASSGSSASLTPPALPRPPVSTCALTTTWPPSSSAAARASSGVVASRPSETGMPKRAKELLALVLVEVHRRRTLVNRLGRRPFGRRETHLRRFGLQPALGRGWPTRPQARSNSRRRSDDARGRLSFAAIGGSVGRVRRRSAWPARRPARPARPRASRQARRDARDLVLHLHRLDDADHLARR